MTTKAAAKRKVAAVISADQDHIFDVDLLEVRDLARRIRKALCLDVTEATKDDARDLTRFLAVVEALAGVLEIELRMTDFMGKRH